MMVDADMERLAAAPLAARRAMTAAREGAGHRGRRLCRTASGAAPAPRAATRWRRHAGPGGPAVDWGAGRRRARRSRCRSRSRTTRRSVRRSLGSGGGGSSGRRRIGAPGAAGSRAGPGRSTPPGPPGSRPPRRRPRGGRVDPLCSGVDRRGLRRRRRRPRVERPTRCGRSRPTRPARSAPRSQLSRRAPDRSPGHGRPPVSSHRAGPEPDVRGAGVRRAARAARAVGTRATVPTGNLDPVRDLLDVRDVVRRVSSLCSSTASPGEVYNVARGDGISAARAVRAARGLIGGRGAGGRPCAGSERRHPASRG